jgi:hypothetical protein
VGEGRSREASPYPDHDERVAAAREFERVMYAGRSVTAPDICSVKILAHPASVRASRCKARSGLPSVMTMYSLSRIEIQQRTREGRLRIESMERSMAIALPAPRLIDVVFYWLGRLA